MHSPHNEQPSTSHLIAFENSIPVFEKHFEDRTDQETDLLAALLEKIPYIKQKSQCLQYPQEYLKSLSRLFSYQFLPKGQAICHYGETPNNFWILLKGNLRKYILKSSEESAPKEQTLKVQQEKVQVQTKKEVLGGWDVPSDDSLQDIEKYSVSPTLSKPTQAVSPRFTAGNWMIKKPSEKESPSQTTTLRSLDELEVFREFNAHNKYVMPNNVLSFKMDKVLGPGDSSTSIAKNVNKQYSSTLVAWTDVHFISIPLKTFFGEFTEQDRTQHDKILFLQQVFPGLTNNSLLKMATLFHEKVLRRGQILFDEDSECSEFYLVKKGEVELSKTQTLENNSPQENKSKTRHSKILDTQIMVVTSTQFIGEEVILNYEKRIFKAEGKAPKSILYFISKADLTDLGDANPKIIWNLFQNAERSLKHKMFKLFSNQKEAEFLLLSKAKSQPASKGKKKDELKKILNQSTVDLPRQTPLTNTGSLSPTFNDLSGSSFICHQKLHGFTKYKKFQNIALLNTKSDKNFTVLEEKSKKWTNESSPGFSRNHKKAVSNCIEISKEALADSNNKFQHTSTTTRDAQAITTPWKSPSSKIIGSQRAEATPNDGESTRNRHQRSMNETFLKPIVENGWSHPKMTSQSPVKASMNLGLTYDGFRHVHSNSVEKFMIREFNDIMSPKGSEYRANKMSRDPGNIKFSMERDLSEVRNSDKMTLQSRIYTIHLEKSLEEEDEEDIRKHSLSYKKDKGRKIIYQGNFRSRKYVEKLKSGVHDEQQKLLESFLQTGNERDNANDSLESLEDHETKHAIEKALRRDVENVRRDEKMALPHLPEKLKNFRTTNYLFKLNSPV